MNGSCLTCGSAGPNKRLGENLTPICRDCWMGQPTEESRESMAIMWRSAV